MICDLFSGCDEARTFFSLHPVIFKVQNIVDNAENIKIDHKDLRPPWELFAIEFKWPETSTTSCLGIKYTKCQSFFNLEMFVFLHSPTFGNKHARFIGKLDGVKISTDGKNIVDAGRFFPSKESKYLLPNYLIEDLLNTQLPVFATSVTFSNLKNVSKVENLLNFGLVRKRRLENKHPIEKFYTLKIDKSKIKKAGLTQMKGDLWKLPLSVVRGHSKDYSNGRGLFGKIKKPDVWFDSFVRGAYETGIIHKEYEAAV